MNPRVELIERVIFDNMEDAAACSHRPENVTRLWQDANSRHLMATRIDEALTAAAIPPPTPPPLKELSPLPPEAFGLVPERWVPSMPKLAPMQEHTLVRTYTRPWRRLWRKTVWWRCPYCDLQLDGMLPAPTDEPCPNDWSQRYE